jgi:prephenate dehydratase/prephenate dehydrogenase
MTNTGSGASSNAPRQLVVVGATAGMGRWLVDHLLLDRPWEQVVLVDSIDRQLDSLEHFVTEAPDVRIIGCRPPEPGEALRPYMTTTGSTLRDHDPVRLDDPATVALLAVPPEAVPGVLDWLVPLLPTEGVIGVVSGTQVASIDAVASRWPSDQIFGIHPLFDSSARTVEGQTFLLIGANGPPTSPWLDALISSGGAIADSGSAADHDAIMRVVQTATHQSLITFADTVTSSGVDLQKLWEARTPVFEGLFGLAARVLAERQQATIAGIQTTMGGASTVDQLGTAIERWKQVVDGPADEIEAALAAIRDRFGGTLFDTIQATAATAVSAAQAKRADLARHRRLGSLVGVRPIGAPHRLRVGRIIDVTPVSVRLKPLMAGKEGAAVLTEGPGARNAARVGVAGAQNEVEFGLGHIEVVVGDELDAALDTWLTFIKRDIRFLVPESIAGGGVLTIVADHPGIRQAEVVSQAVRTGQREVIVRVHIRADHDVDDMAESLRARVQATYVWPAGLSLATAATHVHYLGPAGTFSETAAKQARTESGRDWIFLEPQPDFPAILASIGNDQLGVLPITSSASGLVTRSVQALLDHPGALAFGGVVDVAVRIDAHIAEGRQLADLKGARVLSHPQALGQCQYFIRRWQLEPVPYSSTAEALRRIATEPDAVALAGPGFDLPSGVRVAEREVDDLSGSITRFLVLGGDDSFGEMTGGSDPTLRSLWVAESVATVLAMIRPGAPAFDELLTDADGRCLWVTSRQFAGEEPNGARYLGRAPWSPRTPVVRVEVDVAR